MTANMDGLVSRRPSTKRLRLFARFGIPALVLVGSMAAWGYMTDFSERINELFTAHDRIELEEEFDPPETLNPGDYVVKRAWVRNVGDIDCYVRAMCLLSTDDVLPYATLNLSSEGWSAPDSDGWMYCPTVLAPGTSTTTMLEGIQIAPGSPQEAMESFDVFVLAESVQAYGYDTAEEAFASIAGTHGSTTGEGGDDG